MDGERGAKWLVPGHPRREEGAPLRMGKGCRKPRREVGAVPRARHQSFGLPTGFGGLLGAEIETGRFYLVHPQRWGAHSMAGRNAEGHSK